jgi:chromosome segregation ATPase
MADADNAPVRASSKDNVINNNVHPNSRAARGDEAIDAERRAREAAAPVATSEDQVNGGEKDARIQQLENELAEARDLITDLEAGAGDHDTQLAEANKTVEAAQADVTAAQKERDEAISRAEKAEAEVKKLQDAAKSAKPATGAQNAPQQ